MPDHQNLTAGLAGSDSQSWKCFDTLACNGFLTLIADQSCFLRETGA